MNQTNSRMQLKLIKLVLFALIVSLHSCKMNNKCRIDIKGNVYIVYNNHRIDTIYKTVDYLNYNYFINRNLYDSFSSYNSLVKTIQNDTTFVNNEARKSYDIKFLEYYYKKYLKIKYKNLISNDSLFLDFISLISKTQFNLYSINYEYDVFPIMSNTALNDFYISFLKNETKKNVKYKYGILDKRYVEYTQERNANQLKIVADSVSKIKIGLDTILFIVKKNRNLSGKELLFLITIGKDTEGYIILNKIFLNPQLYNSKYFILIEDLLESDLYPSN